MEKKLRVASLCVQGGYEPKNGEPIEVPIIQSTTFKYDNSEEMAMLFDLKKEGYFYSRTLPMMLWQRKSLSSKVAWVPY